MDDRQATRATQTTSTWRIFHAGPGQPQPVTPWVEVSAEYFRVFGLKLLDGRLFDAHDTARRAKTSIVVDRAWARRFFPGQRRRQAPEERRLQRRAPGRRSSASSRGQVRRTRRRRSGRRLYADAGQGRSLAGSFSGRTRYLIVRTAVTPSSIVPRCDKYLRDLDPTVPFVAASRRWTSSSRVAASSRARCRCWSAGLPSSRWSSRSSASTA